MKRLSCVSFLLLLFVLFAGTDVQAQQQGMYDTIIKGGHVIDPANNISGTMDVAILDGKIARVAKDIPESSIKEKIDSEGAIRVIDASGYYVTPGLLDIHTHVYPLQAGDSSRPNPRDHAFNSGVTACCDAGSVGANDIQEAIDFFWKEDGTVKGVSMPRVFFFCNISAIGMAGNAQKEQFNVPLAVKVAKDHPGIIVGYKSYCSGDYNGDPWAVVDAAVEASRQTGLPVMYDFSPRTNRPYVELITNKMLPGHIHTHYSATQFPVIMDDGKVNPALIAAQKRGVIFDVGHGSGSMVFRNAVPSIKQGFIPNSISTDLHGRNSNSPVLSMINVMSKYLNMGLSLDTVIKLSTVNPAKEIKHPELGTLSVGSSADVAILNLREGTFYYTDCSPNQDLTGGGRLKGDKKLECIFTLFKGRVVHDITGLTYRNWEDIPKTDPYYGDQSGRPVMGTSY